MDLFQSIIALSVVLFVLIVLILFIQEIMEEE